MKRAAALETDNRNIGLIVNADGEREITSPFIHVEGVKEATTAYENALNDYLASTDYTSLDDAYKPDALKAKIEQLKEANYFAIAKGDNAIAIGKKANAKLEGSVALGFESVADRNAGESGGYDFTTGQPSTDASSKWTSTHAAVSVGNGTTVTRQITGVAAGTADTDAVNVAQLKKAVWNIGLAAEGGTVKNPTDGYSLDVKTTVVGNGKNKVQFVAGKGITLSSVPYSTVSTNDTYGIAISTRFEALETTPDNVATAIYYDGIRYTIASGGSSASLGHRDQQSSG